MPLEPVGPIDTAPLFAPLHGELIALLRGLGDDDWLRPTIAGAWRVRDVAAHLLDTQLRRLSAQRDGHRLAPDLKVDGYHSLVALINDMNATWVAAARRFSPRVITDLLEMTGPALAAFVESLSLHARAPIAVSWAGDEESENWFDIGREYTEWWHHQMQIRDAVGAPLLLARQWLHPLLEISVRALPHAYASKTGGPIVFEVDGDAWSLVRRRDSKWELFRGAAPDAATTVRTDGDTAWRLLYNALPRAEVLPRVTITGDRALAEPLLGARSVMV